MDSIEQQVAAAETEYEERVASGPTRLRWEGVPLQVGDKAPDFRLESTRESPVRLSSFWQEGPALLMFWRHFGCGCGMERAHQLQEERAHFRGAGASIAIVGQGEPERGAVYAEAYGMVDPILSDPDFEVYQAFGVLEGSFPQIVFDAPKDLQRGDSAAWANLIEERQQLGRPMVDNPWQLQGEFVVGQDGIVYLAYRYQYCEDFPDYRVLVAAIEEAAA